MTSNFEFGKRQKIIIASLLVTIGFLLITQGVNIVFRRYYFIFLLGALSYIFSVWALWTGMTRLKFLVLFILPVFYTISVTSFYFLFPEVRWMTRIPVGIFLGLSFYALLLTQNVFHVASDRNIPLYRAATAVNFIYTIFTSTLIFSLVFSLNLPFYWNGILILLINFPLILQLLWSLRIENITSQMIVYSLISSLILGECVIALSFWNSVPLVKSLLLNTINYVFMGILIDVIQGRISKKVVLEYSGVGAGVFLFIVLFAYLFI